MAYSKEYYEAHKEQWKAARDKYRKGTPEALEAFRKKARDRYANLTPEQKRAFLTKQKEHRDSMPEVTKLRYKMGMRRRQIRQYDKKIQKLQSDLFELKMKDTWDSADFKYSDELYEKIKMLQEKIDKKAKEIESLEKEREKLLWCHTLVGT